MTTRRKHKTLTLNDKMEIINMLDNGETMTAVAERYGIGRSTIYDIKVKRSKILQYVSLSVKRKTLRFGKYPEVDTDLYDWFLEQRLLNNPIIGDHLKDKAREIYMKKTGKEFKASSGWLDKFKKRYGIKFNSSGASGEKSSFKSEDENVMVKFITDFKEKVDQLCLTPDQLYCADASGLLCRVLERKCVPKEEESKKMSKDRITFMPCSNATATHKLELLVVGKETPEELEVSALPVCYKYQTNGWITRDLFTEWFHEEFVPNVRSFMSMNNMPEKALLVLDEAPGYPEEYYLKSNDWMIQAIFLPAEYSQLIQPMDRRVIQTIKSSFKRKLLLDIMSKDGDLRLNLKEVTLKNVLFILADAWSSLSGNIIRTSWKKLSSDVDIIDDIDDDVITAEDLMVAFRGTGIDEKEISDWLAGSIKEIHEVTSECMHNETIIRLVKPEDPLELRNCVKSSDLDSSSVTTVTVSVKTEDIQDS